jgi:hypothetical protein
VVAGVRRQRQWLLASTSRVVHAKMPGDGFLDHGPKRLLVIHDSILWRACY